MRVSGCGSQAKPPLWHSLPSGCGARCKTLSDGPLQSRTINELHINRQVKMRAGHEPLRIACAALALVVATSCASGRRVDSYLPIASGALYSSNTNDGVVLTLPLSNADAIARVQTAFARAGYASDSVARRPRSIQTGRRAVAGDTTMRVIVQVTSLEPSATGSRLVVTADYSTPSGKQFNRPIIQRAGSINPLFQRLREFANVIAQEP